MSKEDVLGKIQVTAPDVLASTEKKWALEMERLYLFMLLIYLAFQRSNRVDIELVNT
jgi:hypothetical protein